MPRFYCSQSLNVGASVVLEADAAHHVRVRRLASGQAITLFNGAGGEYRATLVAIDTGTVQVSVEQFVAREAEPGYAVTLAQALPEAAKMDGIVEKAVELGATVIQPLAAQRCVVKLAGERAERRRAHWQRIAIGACEQSGRNRIPTVLEPLPLSAWLARRPDATSPCILLSPRGATSLAAWARQQPPQAVQLLIGPEGGFSDDEERLAAAHGALALSIGARVVRTETAGLLALATLSACWEQC
jgi:16S rRNA (uracil1498-N3)-methyltransferase